jgi:Ca2+-binding RTX toxin-like protein
LFAAIGTSLTAGEFWAAAGATSAHDSTDHIIYDTSTGRLYYDGDAAGGASAVHFATIGNKLSTLSYTDFDMI